MKKVDEVYAIRVVKEEKEGRKRRRSERYRPRLEWHQNGR